MRKRARKKARVAIIGGGLAGATLAASMSDAFRITVLERGKRRGRFEPRIISTGHPIGMRATSCYGLGGTTALWGGALLDMEPDEYEPWEAEPDQSSLDLQREFIRFIASPACLTAFDERTRSWLSSNTVLLTSLLLPRPTPRLSSSLSWTKVDVRESCFAIALEETDSGVNVAYSNSGSLEFEKFDFVVVAGGALNSPLLIQRSGLACATAGKNLTDHPTGLVAKLRFNDASAITAALSQPAPTLRTLFKIRDKSTSLWSSFQIFPTPDDRLDSDHYLLNVNSNLLRKRQLDIHRLISPELLMFNLRKSLGRISVARYGYVLAMLEQEATNSNRIIADSHNHVILNWNVSEQSVAGLERSLRQLANSLSADLILPDCGLANRLWSGAHHAGTCRMSNDPRFGAVDMNLRVHDTSRIFICDASVLPSTGATHTSLQIGMLALRLAKNMHDLASH